MTKSLFFLTSSALALCVGLGAQAFAQTTLKPMEWKAAQNASTIPFESADAPDGAELPRDISVFQIGLQERENGLWVRILLTRTLERVRIKDKRVESVRGSSTLLNGVIAQLFIPQNSQLSMAELWAAIWTKESTPYTDSGFLQRAPLTRALADRIASEYSKGGFVTDAIQSEKIPPLVMNVATDASYPIDPENVERGSVSGLDKFLAINRSWVFKSKGNWDRVMALQTNTAPKGATAQELDRGQLAADANSGIDFSGLKDLMATMGRCLNPFKWGKKT